MCWESTQRGPQSIHCTSTLTFSSCLFAKNKHIKPKIRCGSHLRKLNLQEDSLGWVTKSGLWSQSFFLGPNPPSSALPVIALQEQPDQISLLQTEVTQLTAASQSYDIVYETDKSQTLTSTEQKTFPDFSTFPAVIPRSLTLPALERKEEILKKGGMPALIRKGISKAPWQEQGKNT